MAVAIPVCRVISSKLFLPKIHTHAHRRRERAVLQGLPLSRPGAQFFVFVLWWPPRHRLSLLLPAGFESLHCPSTRAHRHVCSAMDCHLPLCCVQLLPSPCSHYHRGGCLVFLVQERGRREPRRSLQAWCRYGGHEMSSCTD